MRKVEADEKKARFGLPCKPLTISGGVEFESHVLRHCNPGSRYLWLRKLVGADRIRVILFAFQILTGVFHLS
jgi:hypothetical protein